MSEFVISFFVELFCNDYEVLVCEKGLKFIVEICDVCLYIDKVLLC